MEDAGVETSNPTDDCPQQYVLPEAGQSPTLRFGNNPINASCQKVRPANVKQLKGRPREQAA
ncbi:hypothetical protein [Hymenobacter sp. DG01]|uniref:hypothetical protein n=1 Tax=Hymenobacter sp. DG01 TaxID=2584940 RepID=UPI00111E2EF7|nr:hypothetical protein [Hymenobacter sp. DG01]